MKDLAIWLSKIMLGWWGDQVIISLLFLLYLYLHRKKSLPDEQLPKTAVILYIRGANPFLSNCLQALLNQNYPQYDLKLIVDSQEDPAWNIVTDTCQQVATNVQVSTLRMPSYNCSLKCSSLIQAVSELDDSYKVVALVDTDVVVHSNWLRELVSPLAHPKVGATTGNRWYVPTGRYWGSLIRYMWNLSTVVQMYFFGIPWGGTLALKTELIHQTGLLDKWKQAYSEDMMIRRVLAKHGKRVVFVPSLIILNREECNLQSIYHWFERQLLSSRLYHPHWWGVVADAIFSILIPHSVLVLFVVAFLTGQWDAATLFFDSFNAYMLALLILAIALEKGVQQVLSQQNQPATKLSPATVMEMFIALPLTQWVYGLAFLSSLSMTKVNWRGVTYQVKGPWNIRLIKYRPYQELDQPDDSKVSL